MPRRCCLALAVSVALAAPLALWGGPASATAKAATPYDFDGNGHPDLVVGAPFLQVGSERAAGGIAVLSASSAGLSKQATVITQATAGVPDEPEDNDLFGGPVASADFDRDGYADLVVGQPNETIGDLHAAGAVTVLYGSRGGLDPARSVQTTRPGGSLAEVAFGSVFTATDLDADGYADLAIDVPGAGESGNFALGILRGSAQGLDRTPSSVSEAAAGGVLVPADLNGDGVTDLVVGDSGSQKLYDDEDGTIDATPGSVKVCRGSKTLDFSCATIAAGNRYTSLASLAVGNMSGDATPEIAVGVPDGDDAESPKPGSVHLLELQGLTGKARDTMLTQSSRGVPGTDKTQSERNDRFGSAVVLGDLDRDGYADLVVGAPGEDTGRGRVTVVHGAKSGWRTSGNTAYDQDTKGVPSKAHRAEGFGEALALADHNADGRLDLTVGAGGGDKAAGGAVSVLRGGKKDLTTQGARTFGLGDLGYPTPNEAGFGEILGA